MKKIDVSRVSGISYSTVLKDIKNGDLYCFDGKHITREECFNYCMWRYETGRVYMYSLDKIRCRLNEWPAE